MRKIFSLLIVMFFAFPAFADGLTEPQKIDALLDTLSNSQVTFIRNGESMDTEAARQHLEDKLKTTKAVVTVEDFIAKVASQSSHTGKPYLIKLKNGKEVESATWFRERLKELLIDEQETME